MKTINSFLEKLQKQVTIHLRAQEELKEISIFCRQENNYESILKEFIQSGSGLCISVRNPIPIRITPGETNVSFEEIRLRIRILENPLVKTKGISSLAVAEHISKSLHHFKPKIEDWQGWLIINPYLPWKEIYDPQQSAHYILDIRFKIQGSTIINHQQ